MLDSHIIARNRAQLLDDIASAALRAGRNPADVTLLAVTKSVDMGDIEALARAGQVDMGENRTEQLLARHAEAAERQLDVRWHMIGHLQRRKVRDLLPAVTMIHSVDSLKLAEEIHKRAAAAMQDSPDGLDTAIVEPVQVLLEVNVSGEIQKQGIFPDEVEEVVRDMAPLTHIDLRGLMTMAPLTDDAEEVRPIFSQLRQLRDKLNDRAAYGRGLTELSMGMSQDYRIAVEEGATIVRVGSSLFEA